MSTADANWNTNGFNSELIHLYCLPPVRDADEILNNEKYIKAVENVKKYYISEHKNDIDNFNYLLHFYAYILEALFDLGEVEIV